MKELNIALESLEGFLLEHSLGFLACTKTKQCLIKNIIFFSGLGDGDIDAGSSGSLWCQISNSANIDNDNV